MIGFLERGAQRIARLTAKFDELVAALQQAEVQCQEDWETKQLAIGRLEAEAKGIRDAARRAKSLREGIMRLLGEGGE